MIAIVNYGLGNIQAIANIYGRINLPVRIASCAAELAGAKKVILPGVGAFDWAMDRLNKSGMRDALDELVLGQQVPVLGICVGMQMLARSSDEGIIPGLGWINGEVKKFDPAGARETTRLPHMGWNDVTVVQPGGLFSGLESDARFYFLHSYYFSAPDSGNVMAVTEYGFPFASSVRSDNVYGVQFHPEKSHQWGIRLLKNFAEL